MLLPLLLTLLLACPAPTSPSEDSGRPDTGEPACRVPDESDTPLAELGVEVDAVLTTVARVSWTRSAGSEAWVWFGREGDALRETKGKPADGGGERAVLLGLKADTEYVYRVVAEVDGELLCTEEARFRTGTLPAGLPAVAVESPAGPGAVSGYTLLPIRDVLGAAGSWATVVDMEGDYVWFLSVDALRMRLSLDGEALVFNDRSYGIDSPSRITRAPLDGSPITDVTVPGGHSDFVEVEPGTYATFDWEVRSFEDGARQIAGERLVEVGPDGSVREIWNVFDDLVPDLSREYGRDIQGSPELEVWPHLNHLHYDPVEDAYIVTARATESVHRVERATGRLSWTLGGVDGDFAGEGDELRFNPHSAMPTERGVLLFDTGSFQDPACSAGVELDLDLEAWTAARSWQYSTDDCLRTDFLGNSDLLWSGNRTLVLAMSAQMDEVSAEGELLWRLRLATGWWLLYAGRVPELGG